MNDIPTTTFGKTGVQVSVIGQGGARMDLHPDIRTAAADVRRVYDLGVTYFDCARRYWDGRSEEAYGLGLRGVRKGVFLTTRTQQMTGLTRHVSRSGRRRCRHRPLPRSCDDSVAPVRRPLTAPARHDTSEAEASWLGRGSSARRGAP